MDTTSIEFQGVYDFWTDYVDTLFVYTIKSKFKIQETNESINSFWAQQDVNNYTFPDLIYASNFGMAFYPTETEYFLGVAYRDTNLFELRTMFIHNNESVFNNFPDIMMSVFVIKDGNTYKLFNKFSKLKEENKIVDNKVGDITYYYSPYYQFSIENARLLQKRILKFKQDFNIEYDQEINYLIGDNFSEILSWFGVNYYNIDYNGTKSSIEGRFLPLNNMILSGGGGENYMHEIIHVLLNGIRKGNYNLFEEGIACYFGDHQGQNYQYHLKRLKRYLINNEWINLSESIKGYYSNSETDHSYSILDDKNPMKDFKYYGDDTTSFSYLIHAVLCDMAFKQGGATKVLKILSTESNADTDFYSVIEDQLGIKRENMDEAIRTFIANNHE